MANIKISELTELEQVDNDDLLVIVDTSANETKKVKARNVGTGGGGSDVVIISDTQPTSEDNKLFIDTSEDGNSFTEITNEYSTSTGKGYSANYINELNTYSTAEQRIGTWFGKPIYRKVIDLGSLPNNTYKEVSTGLINTNISLTKIYGFAYTSTRDSQVALGDIYTRFEVRSGNNVIRVTTTANYSAYTGYAVLEYTKITD